MGYKVNKKMWGALRTFALYFSKILHPNTEKLKYREVNHFQDKIQRVIFSLVELCNAYKYCLVLPIKKHVNSKIPARSKL